MRIKEALVLCMAVAVTTECLAGVGPGPEFGFAGSAGGARIEQPALPPPTVPAPAAEAPGAPVFVGPVQEKRKAGRELEREEQRRETAARVFDGVLNRRGGSVPSGNAFIAVPPATDNTAGVGALIDSMTERRDPLEGPEWDPNHDMRGILYDQNGREIRRLGRESTPHRQAREARERRARERLERERREREARERAERERVERERREQARREERAQREREARERAEREARERAERAQRERAEREARQRAEREARERAAREEAERDRATARRTPTREEQLAAASNARSRQSEDRRRLDEAQRRYDEEARRYRNSTTNIPGFTGVDDPRATVVETAIEAASPGPIPSGTINAVGELNRVGPVLDARRRLIEELSR